MRKKVNMNIQKMKNNQNNKNKVLNKILNNNKMIITMINMKVIIMKKNMKKNQHIIIKKMNIITNTFKRSKHMMK